MATPRHTWANGSAGGTPLIATKLNELEQDVADALAGGGGGGGGGSAISINGVFTSSIDINTDPVTPGDIAAQAARRYATAITHCWDNSVVTVALGGTSFTNAAFDLTVADTIKVTTAGTYLVTAEIGMASAGGGTGPRTGLIQVNGATVREFGSPGATVRWSAAAALVLAAGDTVTLAAFAVGGTAGSPDDVTTLAAAAKDTGLTVVKLGA